MSKAQELSILCNLKVNISFFDPNMNRVVEYASDPNFTMHNLVCRVNGGDEQLDPVSPSLKKVKHKLISGDDIVGVADSGNGDENNDSDRPDDKDVR